jgi:hypothetical protein
MKLRAAVIAILCIGLICSVSMVYAQGKKAAPAATKTVAMPKITVLNPMGTPPPITLKPMVEPPATLDGKTIYFVNTGYLGTDRLMAVMQDWFKANYPNAKLEYRVSRGSMTNVDKELWAEMGEKADAVVIGLGH